MRKLIGLTVALLVVGLLMMTAVPASAQLADPLSLAASGVLLPFFNDTTAGFVSVFEVISPVVPTVVGTTLPSPNPSNSTTNPIHAVFFDNTCGRRQSTGITETEKQAVALNGNAAPLSLTFNGIAAIAQTVNQSDLLPLRWPIHTRTHWIDVQVGKLRELEPITLDTFLSATAFSAANIGQTTGFSTGQGGALVWNPLRSAANFVTPQEGGATGLTATLFLVCPRNTIQGNGTTPTNATGNGIFATAVTGTVNVNQTAGGFPALVNRDGSIGFPPPSTVTTNAVNTLRALVWDDDETPKRDLTLTCDCLTTRTVASLDAVYTTAPTNLGPQTIPVWYTELIEQLSTWNPVAAPPIAQQHSFTGYWNLDVTGRSATLFHRLSNASRDNLNTPAANGGATGAVGAQNNR